MPEFERIGTHEQSLLRPLEDAYFIHMGLTINYWIYCKLILVRKDVLNSTSSSMFFGISTRIYTECLIATDTDSSRCI